MSEKILSSLYAEGIEERLSVLEGISSVPLTMISRLKVLSVNGSLNDLAEVGRL